MSETWVDDVDDDDERTDYAWYERALLGCAGLGLLTAGLFATFVKSSTGSAVALLLLGSLLGFLALTGQRLEELSFGGAGTKFARKRGERKGAEEVLDAIYADPGLDERTSIRVAENVRRVPAVKDLAQLQGRTYLDAVHSALRRVRPDLIVSTVQQDAGFDILLSQGVRDLRVLLKYFQIANPGDIFSIAPGVYEGRADLIITNQILQNGSTQTVHFVSWSDQTDDPFLQQVLNTLLPL